MAFGRLRLLLAVMRFAGFHQHAAHWAIYVDAYNLNVAFAIAHFRLHGSASPSIPICEAPLRDESLTPADATLISTLMMVHHAVAAHGNTLGTVQPLFVAAVAFMGEHSSPGTVFAGSEVLARLLTDCELCIHHEPSSRSPRPAPAF